MRKIQFSLVGILLGLLVACSAATAVGPPWSQDRFLQLPPWPDGLAVLEQVNLKTAEICKLHPSVQLLDVHQLFRDHGIHHRQNYWYYANLEDPNDQGYNALYGMFSAAIEAPLVRR